MKNRKVTPEQREEILRRAREGGKGNLQKIIARDMGLDKDTVRKVEAAAGLRRHPGHVWTPEEEKAAIAMLIEGHGQPHIERALSLPAGTAREFIVRFRGRQARGGMGYRYEFSALERRAIARDLREARRSVAKKWKVSLVWIREFDALKKYNHRKAHEPLPFLPKAQDLLRLLRTLLPNGIPFKPQHDSAAIEGLMQGVSTFIPLPTEYGNGLRVRFAEGLAMLRKEESGIWVH